jgi:hypothetical protein
MVVLPEGDDKVLLPEGDDKVLLQEGEDSESGSDVDVVSLSSTSGTSGPLHDQSPAKDAEKEMRNKMISKEEKNVRNARFIVVAAGIACAAAVGAAINIFAHQNDQATFELEVRKSRRELKLIMITCVTEKTSLT